MQFPALLPGSMEPSSTEGSFGRRLTDSRAFLFPFYVVLSFDECVGTHVVGGSLFLETNLSRSNSIAMHGWPKPGGSQSFPRDVVQANGGPGLGGAMDEPTLGMKTWVPEQGG
ncbi:hypothetical protein llap_20268 [Limosa lapponica baueri]|uniref:Uncharacterized protein n=1 Tax=Limosa lapponica baueri TaxID=1758121 RepID=A0A2I0T6L6_LIMLA|nr:hypothetical protein llap_20268 [Limosa lapponica baueri]